MSDQKGTKRPYLSSPEYIDYSSGSQQTSNQDQDVRKRNRPSFVCTSCKKRKIKCDRNLPCSSCIKAKTPQTCKYEHPSVVHLLPTEGQSPHPIVTGIHSYDSEKQPSFPSPYASNSHHYNNIQREFQKGSQIYAGVYPYQGTTTETESLISEISPAISTESILKKDVETLKRQILNMERQLQESSNSDNNNSNNNNNNNKSSNASYITTAPPSVSPYTPGSISIFDIKSKKFKIDCIVFKKSRLLYFGPLSVRASLMFESRLKTIFTHIYGMLDSERRAWKARNRKTTSPMNQFHSYGTEEEFITEIHEKIIPYFDAFSERLEYFDKYLNLFVLIGIVDMNLVYNYFAVFFKRDSTGKVNFVKPEKNYYYADLSLVIAIVRITVLFTTSETVFEHKLEDPMGDLSRLASYALNLSNFNAKQSVNALLALLVTRLGTFLYSTEGEGEGGSKGYPSFQTAIGLAYQLGVHRVPDSISIVLRKGVDNTPFPNYGRQWKQIFNYMKLADAHYALSLGSPLLIDDLYCDADEYESPDSFDDINHALAGLIKVFRDTVRLINSVTPVSINEIIEMLNKVMKYQSDLDPITSLLFPIETMAKYQNRDLLAWLLLCKINTLELIASLQNYLRFILGNTHLFEFTNDDGTKREVTADQLQLLKETTEKYELAALRTCILLLSVIHRLTNGKSVFKNDVKYIMFFKPRIRMGLFKIYAVLLSFVLNKSIDPEKSCVNRYHDEDIVMDAERFKLENIDMKFLERTLRPDFEECNCPELDSFNKDFTCSKRLIRLLVEYYEASNKNKILAEDYGFFFHFKIVMFFCYFVESLKEINKGRENTSGGTSLAAPENPLKHLEDAVKLTKQKVMSNSTLGVVDTNLRIFEDEFKLDDILQTMTTEYSLDVLMRMVFDNDEQQTQFRNEFESGDNTGLNIIPGSDLGTAVARAAISDGEFASQQGNASNSAVNQFDNTQTEEGRSSATYQLFF